MIQHKRKTRDNDKALTGLEIVILLVVAVLIIGYLGYGEITHGKNRRQDSKNRNRV